MPLCEAIALVTDAVVSAGARGVPLAGMKLDYDLTIVEIQARQLCGAGFRERGWRGPVLDAGVIDRHFDRERQGRRTLGDLCAHYGIDIANAHDASADAIASVEVLYALAERYDELSEVDLAQLFDDQIVWHRQWTQEYDVWRLSQGMAAIDPRDYVWPVAPAVLGSGLNQSGLEEVPDHVDPLVLGEDDLGGMLLFDVADESVVDRVPDQFL